MTTAEIGNPAYRQGSLTTLLLGALSIPVMLDNPVVGVALGIGAVVSGLRCKMANGECGTTSRLGVTLGVLSILLLVGTVIGSWK